MKNVAMAWNDYKKHDMVLKHWIKHSFKIDKIFDEVIMFIKNSMENWSVEMTAGGKS